MRCKKSSAFEIRDFFSVNILASFLMRLHLVFRCTEVSVYNTVAAVFSKYGIEYLYFTWKHIILN